jgi:hypothetical protein
MFTLSSPTAGSPRDKLDHTTDMAEACASDIERVIELIETARKDDEEDGAKSSSKTPLMVSNYGGYLGKLVNHEQPILIAASKGFFAIVALLIKNGAEPNVKDEHGRNILYYLAEYACKNRKADEVYLRHVDVLFNEAKAAGHSLDPNLADTYGITPVMYANVNGHARLVEKLFEKGASLTHDQRKSQVSMEKSKTLIGADATVALSVLSKQSSYVAPTLSL